MASSNDSSHPFDAQRTPSVVSCCAPGDTPTSSYSDWSDLVDRIGKGDGRAEENLYGRLREGVRFLLFRHLGPDGVEDELHEVFVIVLEAIREQQIAHPERLPGYIRGVVQRRIAGVIRERTRGRAAVSDVSNIHGPADHRPDQAFHLEERAALMREVLRSLSPRDQEILQRFYIADQSQEQICEEMKLTDTQFRLLKSRAKAKFTHSAHRQHARRELFCLARKGSA